MSIRIECNCGKTYQVKETLAGRSAKCKSCGNVIHIPTKNTPDAPDTSQKIQFKCQCGKQYSVNKNLAGKRVRCKKCSNILTIPEHSTKETIPVQPEKQDTPQKYKKMDQPEQSEKISKKDYDSLGKVKPPFKRKSKFLAFLLVLLAAVTVLAGSAYLFWNQLNYMQEDQNQVQDSSEKSTPVTPSDQLTTPPQETPQTQDSQTQSPDQQSQDINDMQQKNDADVPQPPAMPDVKRSEALSNNPTEKKEAVQEQVIPDESEQPQTVTVPDNQVVSETPAQEVKKESSSLMKDFSNKSEPSVPSIPTPPPPAVPQQVEAITQTPPQTQISNAPDQTSSEPVSTPEKKEEIIQPKPEPVAKPTQIPEPVKQKNIEKQTPSIPQPQPKPISHAQPNEESKAIQLAAISSQKPKIIDPRLRGFPLKFSTKYAVEMLTERNLFDRRWNKTGDYANKFVDNHDGTITDQTSGLMWQKGGSTDMMEWSSIAQYIESLNKEKFGGFDDWRLPTLEELLSLTEQRNTREGLYVSPLFSQKQGICCSSDMCQYENEEYPWFASFLQGVANCNTYGMIKSYYVRAVRSIGSKP